MSESSRAIARCALGAAAGDGALRPPRDTPRDGNVDTVHSLRKPFPGPSGRGGSARGGDAKMRVAATDEDRGTSWPGCKNTRGSARRPSISFANAAVIFARASASSGVAAGRDTDFACG